MATIYDSRAFVKRLIEAGMSEGQADTLASENLLLIAEHLATKDDLRALATKEELRAEIAAVRADMVTKAEFKAGFDLLRAEIAANSEKLRADIASLENRLLMKLAGIMTVLLAIFQLF